MMALKAMRAAFGVNAEVVAGVLLPLTAMSEPEPDVMVLASDLRRDIRREDVLLVVEVADTSLKSDQTVKAALYARHGIPEYVLLDVTNRRLEIRRSPRPEHEDWRETIVLTDEGEFTPLSASGSIRVADLLPDPEP